MNTYVDNRPVSISEDFVSHNNGNYIYSQIQFYRMSIHPNIKRHGRTFVSNAQLENLTLFKICMQYFLIQLNILRTYEWINSFQKCFYLWPKKKFQLKYNFIYNVWQAALSGQLLNLKVIVTTNSGESVHHRRQFSFTVISA